MAGWFFDVPILKSPGHSFLDTTFISALCFVMVGIILFFLSKVVHSKPEAGDLISLAATLVILILITSTLISKLIGIDIGVENLFKKERLCSIFSVCPGQPSVATMVGFIIVALSDIIIKCGCRRVRPLFISGGVVIFAMGLVAVLGYVFHNSYMMFYFPGFSSAVSIYSAALFTLIGAALITLGAGHNNLPA